MAELEKKATTAATTVAVAAELEVLFWYTTGFTRVDLESFTYPSVRDFYAFFGAKVSFTCFKGF